MTNTGVTQLPDYRFSSPDTDLLVISVRLSAIAERLGLTVQAWEEDGLGPASGAFVRLPSGVVVLMLELEHAVKHLGAKGPTFLVGAADVVAAGAESLVSEILENLGLTKDAIVWMVETETAEYLMARWTQSRS
jgi:hypothetical protein